MRIKDMSKWYWFISSGLIGFVVICAALPVRAGEEDAPLPANVQYNRDIRPIFSDTCFKCHGFDAAKRKKNLRLDTTAGAFGELKSGGTPIVRGHPEKSEAYLRITSGDEDEVMPPSDSGLKITPRQKKLIEKWIQQGAEYQAHWAFIPPARPELPGTKDARWPRNGIDHFVLAKLEQEGLSPSKEADKPTLIRRASLDLTGLPPSPEEVRAFMEDGSANAYEKVVDRLLASPRYGERMAMQWLDGARYADSNGYQADYERFMWRWRDWVITAFNRNQPFDQFTIDQLAGDLLPNATMDQKIATGFNRNHRINTEGGIIPEEWRVETVIDRVETTSAVWLGLTMGCCRCHDHKYDPITQKEFYQFFAFFNNNAMESGTGVERAENHPPLLRVPDAEQRVKTEKLEVAFVAAQKAVAEKEKSLPQLQAAWETSVLEKKPGVAWMVGDVTKMESTGKATLTKQPDQSILVTGANPDTDSYTIEFATSFKEISAIKLEALSGGGLPAGGPGRSSGGNFVMTDIAVTADGKPVKLVKATADYSQPDWPVANAIDQDAKSGWAVYPKVNEPHFAVFSFEQPIRSSEPLKLSVRLDFASVHLQHQLGQFRLLATDSSAPHEAGIPSAFASILKTPGDKRTVKEKVDLAAYFRANHSSEVLSADRELKKAVAERDTFAQLIPTVMVMEESPQPRDAFLLIRGQYDKRGEKVTASTPAALPPMPAGAVANRLGLARWIVDPKNPLTARVAVNRFWERFFGVGLVKSSENFGSQADWPSHPELLDWMATEFVRVGWDMKAIQKTIVMSAAYRQSSAVTSALVERDSENRLMARGPRFRVQAEVVRDQALSIAGLLNEKVGGPSVRPYQPEGIWDEINVYGNLRNYKHDTNGDQYRRSLYTIWKRTSAPPSMTLFDAPGREICVVRRSRTNTPLQALALLNDETYVEASRKLAEKMIVEGGATAEARIAYGFRRATAREPDGHELKVLKVGLEQRLLKYRQHVESAKALVSIGDSKSAAGIDPAELAAYATTASVILNLDETITKE